MGGQGSGSLVELMKGQNDDDRRILKINVNKYIKNTVSTQGEQIFKNDPAMANMISGDSAGKGSPNAGLLASLQNSSSIQKKLKLLMSMKKKPKIRDRLDKMESQQNKVLGEEE